MIYIKKFERVVLPHVEFSYNPVVGSITSHYPFEIVYHFNDNTTASF